MEYNIYCDESCHLEHDNIKIMVLGAIWCTKWKQRDISKRIREIKSEFGLSTKFEVKWNKVSPAKKDLYLRLIDFFFENDDIHFRTLIVPDKSVLNHERFNQSIDSNLKVWRNRRGTRERILILHEIERYLVVLEDRKNYILPWTAYLVEDDSRLRKLLVEYQNCVKKAGVAFDDPVPPLTHGQRDGAKIRHFFNIQIIFKKNHDLCTTTQSSLTDAAPDEKAASIG